MRSSYSDCWANYRGDCDRGMSREHLLSKALFPDRFVYVSGFDWCKHEKRVGIDSLQRRILCAKHNNDLSPTDEAAKHAIDAFAAGDSDKVLNGALLERWLVKTAVNFSIGSSCHLGVGMSDSKPGWPSPYLLAVAFGDEVLCAKMGAYFLFPVVPCVHRAGEILLVPVQKEGFIGGFIFGLRGQFVFLNLFPGHAPPQIHKLVPGLLPESIAMAPLCYRPTVFTVQSQDSNKREVHISWPRA